MPLSIDSALGLMPDALRLREQRSELLASNLANADTPNYKARDFDFRAALSSAMTGQGALSTDNPRQLQPADSQGIGTPVQYRIPGQPSLDGNTVDSQLEKAAFSRNAVRYQATLDFLSGRFKGLMTALKGQ